MYLTHEILEKLNAGSKTKSTLKAAVSEQITLPDIMVRSFAEVKALAGDALSWGEKNFLYQQAQKALKENKMAESRILSRANPQLANAVRLGIHQSSMLGGYDDLFPQRANSFVKPGAVASMFSPAGYLTELYREARGLHAEASQYHLDTRRPDLASLALSQSNMDDELSTLSLSNELLLNNIQSKEGLSYNDVIEKLTTYRQTGSTPFHLPYETTRQSILLQDPAMKAFSNNPSVAAKMDISGLLGITAGISPELHGILTEEITEDNADELIKNNFGDISVTSFQSIAYLARWYGLTYDEMSSLLGIVSTSNDLQPGAQYYRNDSLVSLVRGSDGKLNGITVSRTPKTNVYHLNYAELIPLGANKFAFNYNYADEVLEDGIFSIGTTQWKSDDLLKTETFTPRRNTPYSVTFSLSDEQLSQPVEIGLSRRKVDYGDYCSFIFTLKEYPFGVFLLKLNKLIRLYKATGIAPSDIRTVIESVNDDQVITEDVLSRLFWVNYYAQRYGIDFSAAMVLAGANISQIAHGGRDSAFTRLFNTPPLNNQLFSADGTVLDLEPGKSEDTFRLGVLKRALQVDDTGLFTLYSLAFTDKDSEGKAIDFTTTINNLSALYRTRLLAEVNHISVTELSLLLSVSPYVGRKLDTLTGEKLNGLPGTLERYTQWLNEMNWTVSDLYLMLTGNYSTVLSPDIQNLITTLKNGLANHDSSQSDEAGLIMAVAPFIAAATQLGSAEMATAILQWLDQLTPQGLTVADFLGQVDNDSRNDEQTIQLVSFCQVMGQLALIVRNAGLTASELSWAVGHPRIFTEKATLLGQDIDTLYDLTRLHALLVRCGTHASEILTSLSGNGSSKKGSLAVDTVATALSLNEQALKQALAQVSAYEYFYSWIHLRDALQWLDVATTLSITPDDVAKMVALKFSGADTSPYADWVTVSHALQAGLNAQQTAQLQASLDESLSAALSAYTIKSSITPPEVTDRDKLYSWLLIDNQVSAQVKTTRIAEAIASVQLYVNRALAGQEEGVDNAVKSGRFFTADWDTYNKRYSTWAGVSELVYYPENYVDPTLRLGQTGMMDEMLQILSQSQLASDTVEDAFKTYMTRFEEIANLDIVSGYHDGVSDQDGVTYLIGRSAAGDYYWRSANIDKMSDGKLPANAWTEWAKITTAIAPINKMIHPVIFQSRLYLVWVEAREVAASGDGKTVQSTEYQLKYAHILHDGTWSKPVSITLQPETLPLATSPGSNESTDINTTSIFCSVDSVKNNITVVFYPKKENHKQNPENSKGLVIDANGNVKYESKFPAYFYMQYDTFKNVAINTLMIQPSTSKVSSGEPQWGQSEFSIVQDCTLNVTCAGLSDLGVDINITDIEGDLVFDSPSTEKEHQLEIAKKVSHVGEVILFAQNLQMDTMEIPSPVPPKLILLNMIPLTVKVKKENDEIEYVTYLKPFNKTAETYLPIAYYRNGLGGLNYNGKIIQMHEFETDDEKYALVYRSPNQPENLYFDFALEDDRSGKAVDYITNFTSGNYVEINTDIDNLKLEVINERDNSKIASIDSEIYAARSWDKVHFKFKDQTLNIKNDLFDGAKGLANFSLVISPKQDAKLGSQTLRFSISLGSVIPAIKLNTLTTDTQYMQYGNCRIRVNTLFAKQLVERANTGLNAVLAMETQRLQEPQLGKGNYVYFTLPRYDADTHGDDANTRLIICNANNTSLGSNPTTFWAGVLLDKQQTIKLFVPTSQTAYGDPVQFPEDRNKGLAVFLSFKGKNIYQGVFSDISQADLSLISFTPYKDKDKGMLSAAILQIKTEPMDFSGANALYFWEMFYYVPMMVFKRLLSESRFTEATQWIEYIWSPDGYLVNDQPANFAWNVRPLEEETTWHANPLDSVDPDAVAQADPLHYKVATFMSYLDLLIARGDAAYRQLERDTLNEAKMWYTQALDLLGDEPYLTDAVDWASLRLTDAADKTTQKNVQQALMVVRQQIASGELRTANSLAGLFLPQQNAKLAGYWQTLAQRMYNLRHNLSIDGSPLSLPIYATPADPAALLSAAVNAALGGSDLPAAVMPLYRFPVILESARGMVSQLTQFGSTLLSITERQDAETLSELLQTQGSALVLQSIALQNSTIAEIDADKAALDAARSGAQSRLDGYTTLYDEDVNDGETQAMNLFLSSSILADSGQAFHSAAGALDLVPNIFGLADGGSRWGSAFIALGEIANLAASATHTAADRVSQSEIYRRRRQEWEIQRNAAQSEVNQIDAQLASLAVRREGAVLQKTYLETQQSQTRAQMIFLQNKFTSKALYNWLRGKLAAIYYQFYDLAVSRCLMAEEAYKWASGTESASFIRPGAWQGTYAGLMAGETLMLNLAQMEQAYLQKDQREKEVIRTVCLSEVYAALSSGAFVLADKVAELVKAGKGSTGTDDNGLKVGDKQLQATLKLSDLKIGDDYPVSLGNTRRIKQVSVTLPALVGPYQDVRAVLSYGGSVVVPRGCEALAVSHGMNDSGQFQLDFNDARWLPFEGIPVNDGGTLTLSFPQADSQQKDLLLSLTDIILHIRYTIVS